ncbi:MAG TPA: RNB domain-containing ribonuclease [Gemmatimonadaceae bacterium]
MSGLRTAPTESLTAAAKAELVERGFEPDFPEAVLAEARAAASAPFAGHAAGARDLRDLLWSSIDNAESKDLDQIEYAERQADGSIRLFVGIADVDAFAPKGSALDRHAAINTTTLYLGVAIFPMLPEILSTGTSSLLPGEDRIAHVVQLVVAPDGAVKPEATFTAIVRNKAKLAYETVGSWLADQSPIPEEIGKVPGLEAQVRLQNDATKLLHAYRQQSGAINIDSIEPRAIVKDDKVVDIVALQQNPARDLIEELMIGANTASASLLGARNAPAIRRVVRQPRRWDGIVKVAAELGTTLPSQPDGRALADFLAARRKADPVRFPDLSLTIVKLLGPGEYVLDRAGPEDDEAHFGLGVAKYVHSTAPNRRYADLINQRLLKATDSGSALPYSDDELAAIAAHCNERELEAHRIERSMRKRLAAAALVDRVGQTFDAVVTGKSDKGTYVRVLGPPVEGRLMRGEQQVDVGQRLRVQLTHVDSRKGFIDFAAA